MKTVQEFIRDADNLNKFMTDAAAQKFENHLLATIDDEYTRNVYLTLLISVAETSGEIDETADNPIAYVCRIAAALPVAPDMQEIFRRSLLIDEKVLDDYSVTLKQRGLQNLLLFDALTMQILYAKNAAQLAEYIAGLANIFGTGKDGLGEILSTVKAVINRQEEFKQKFQHVNCFEFLPYLRRSCKNIFVEAADTFFMDFEAERDVTNDLQHPLTLANKKIVHFRNVYLHDKKFSFNVKETTTAEFENCRFENLMDNSVKEFEVHGSQYSFPDEIRLLAFEQVGTVKIVGCKFAGMINNLIDYRESYTILAYSEYVNRGILILIGDINQFTVHDCEFKDCFFRELMPKTTFAPFGSWTGGLIRDKFTPNNFTLDDYLKCAKINFERDRLVGGYDIKSHDIKNISVINSFQF